MISSDCPAKLAEQTRKRSAVFTTRSASLVAGTSYPGYVAVLKTSNQASVEKHMVFRPVHGLCTFQNLDS